MKDLLVDHAKRELNLISDLNDEDDIKYGEKIISMIENFCDLNETDSLSRAMGKIIVLNKLLKFEPLSPLTGEDSEWTQIGTQGENNPLYQNNRSPRVFKTKNDGAYDTEGLIFYELKNQYPYINFFTTKDSHVKINFPYLPFTNYKQYENGDIKND